MITVERTEDNSSPARVGGPVWSRKPFTAWPVNAIGRGWTKRMLSATPLDSRGTKHCWHRI